MVHEAPRILVVVRNNYMLRSNVTLKCHLRFILFVPPFNNVFNFKRKSWLSDVDIYLKWLINNLKNNATWT
jgi:hypothetical protein